MSQCRHEVEPRSGYITCKNATSDSVGVLPELVRGGELAKTLTGIRGLDEITRGGLPTGRPTLVCGGPGSGKTLLALTFLVNGALQFDEPGVLMTFEENAEEIASDVASLGFDLPELIAAKKLAVDYVRVERSEIEETGEYDLEGLFVRLDYAIRTVGAKRVVLDTIESLFAGLKDDAILRAELRRLFRWLKDKGVTAVITGERGEGLLTKQGLEEYVSDAVILLDHRVHDQVSTRRLRVVKYRGSHHGTNEYPFLIDASGISVLPVSSMALEHEAPLDRISAGIPRLDAMLGGKGYYRGSTVLVSGSAGTGKTSLAAHFLDAACRRGERCLCFLFEESPQQLLRNMRSIGIDLEPWVAAGLLQFHADRPSRYGLETHLATMHQVVADFKPTVVVIDPVTNLMTVGTFAGRPGDAHAHDRSPQDREHHGDADEPHARADRRRAHRDDHLVADGHLDRAGERRGRRPPPPRAVRAEVPRHARTPTSFASSC